MNIGGHVSMVMFTHVKYLYHTLFLLSSIFLSSFTAITNNNNLNWASKIGPRRIYIFILSQLCLEFVSLTVREATSTVSISS